MTIWQRLDKLEHKVEDLEFELKWAKNRIDGYETYDGIKRPGLNHYFWGLVAALGYTWQEPDNTVAKVYGEFKRRPKS